MSEPANRDTIEFFDGTTCRVSELAEGELLVLCQQGRVRRINHYRQSKAATGHWRALRNFTPRVGKYHGRAPNERQADCLQGSK